MPAALRDGNAWLSAHKDYSDLTRRPGLYSSIEANSTIGNGTPLNHADHVTLIRNGGPTPGAVWADFGAGAGAFTLALAELLSPGGAIYAVDRDAGALRRNARSIAMRYPAITLHTLDADFTRPVALPSLDGLLIANALHYYRDKDAVVRLLASYLALAGHFLVVEYDTDRGNSWVPYPQSFLSWEKTAERCGLQNTRLIAERPSTFLGRFYAAVSTV